METLINKTETRGERVIRWIEENLFIPDGPKVSQPFILEDFQRDIVLKIYDNPRARTRTAIISLPRKAAKTTLSAALLLVHLVGIESGVNQQLVSTSLTRQQAAILYDYAVKMILFSPFLRPYINIRSTKKELFVSETGNLYRALSADAKNQVGLNPAVHFSDESGQIESSTSDLFEAVETGMLIHPNALTVILSTQAPADHSFLSVKIDNALKDDADPSTVISLYAATDTDDPFDPATLARVHPAWNSFVNQEELLRQQAEAKVSPSQEPSFKNYILNMRVSAEAQFVTKTQWIANGGVPGDWRGQSLTCGLDLSFKRDTTALVGVWRDGEGYGVHNWTWIPGEDLKTKAERDKIDYLGWAKKGLINPVPGSAVISYDYVAEQLYEIAQECTIERVLFDRFGMTHFEQAMLRAGFEPEWIARTFVPYGQGFKDQSTAVNKLEELLLNQKLKHGNNPVLTWQIQNARIITDPSGNRKFDKSKSWRRIDSIVALGQAVAGLEMGEEKKAPSYLESDSLLVL